MCWNDLLGTEKKQNNTAIKGNSHSSCTPFNIVQCLEVGIRPASAFISIIFVVICKSVPHIRVHKFAIYMPNECEFENTFLYQIYSRNRCDTTKYSDSGLAITEYGGSDLQKGGNSVHSQFMENFAKATQFIFILS